MPARGGRTRRDVLALSAGALGVIGLAPTAASRVRAGSCRRPASRRARTRSRPTASPPSATSSSSPTSRISTMSIRMRRRAAPSSSSPAPAPSTFNSLNGFILKGDPAIDMELDVRLADDARLRRARRHLWTCGRAGRGLRATDASTASGCATGIKFHDGSPITAADVAFSLSILKEKGHPNISLDAARHGGRGGRGRPGRGRALRCETRPRRAAACRLAPDLLARLLCDAALQRNHARAAARLRSLSGRTLRARPLSSSSSGSRTGGAPTFRPRADSTISSRALRILPRSRHRLRRLHRQELHVPRGIHLAHLGDAL